MSVLEIVLISYIVISQVVTTIIIFSRSGRNFALLLVILFPFGLIVSLIDDLKRKRARKSRERIFKEGMNNE